MKFTLFTFVSILIMASCGGKDATPKPIAYPRIDRENIVWKDYEDTRFSIEYPNDAKIVPQQSEDNKEVWFNIVYPSYRATIHCTYLPITKSSLPSVLEDNYKLAYSHASKAEGIKQMQYSNEDNNTYGILYDIGGLVAVPVQFFVTDSTTHFFRGSLYYNNQVNNIDSIEPITESLRNDIKRMMSTLQWK